MMNRRMMMNVAALMTTGGIAGVSAQTASPGADHPKPSQRLGQKYRFDDPDMDLFFVAAAGWGPSGGLDIGQAFYVAGQIQDGDADSWIKAFTSYGDLMNEQAESWKRKGWQREAGEARLKAFAAYRSAWQFAEPGEAFARIVARHKVAFAQAINELQLPGTLFKVPFAGKQLPGVYFQNANRQAPTVLIIGGADTCFEELFLTLGRNLFDRGFSVAMADLPGQGITMTDGLHWEAEAEKPIAAITDLLESQFAAKPGRMALIGLSLGGYFVARAAADPVLSKRFATVIASTPFPSPAQMFSLSAQAAEMENQRAAPTPAAVRSRMVTLWKAGARSPEEFVRKTSAMVADPSNVTVPFLSILGGGDSQVFARQARAWHERIRSERKSFVLLDASTGADGHVQVNNRLRLAQECAGWLGDVFGRS